MVVYLFTFVTCYTGLNSNKEEALGIGETIKVSVSELIWNLSFLRFGSSTELR